LNKDESEYPVDNRLKCGRRANCRECEKARHRKFYWDNYEEQIKRIKQNHIKNAAKEKKYREIVWTEGRAWSQNNPILFAEIRRKSRKKTRENINARNRKRFQENPELRLIRSVRKAIWLSLRGNKKNHWENLVGYTLDDLIKHIESQFTEGMNWQNYGQWHIDHIIPIASFRFTLPTDNDFKQCWKLNNLQPMWAMDNYKKAANY